MRQRRGANSGLTPYSQLRFRSDLQQSLISQASKGVATPTFTRATTASVPDFEGIVRTALSSESRFKGARRVENLITASEDMTNGAYITSSGATVSSETQVTFDGTDNQAVWQNVTIVDDGGGAGSRTFAFSCSVSLVSGTISGDSGVKLVFEGNAVGGYSAINIGSQVTSTPQRFVFSRSTDAAGTILQTKLRSDDDVVLEITEWQMEETTGQANQNPSEYVSSGVLSAPYHGANVDAVQYFNTLNGNTVASNVVTEATGALIGASNEYADAKGPFGYMSGAAATNICLQSEDFSTTWTNSNSTDAVNQTTAPDGTTTADTMIVSSDGGSTRHSINQTVSTTLASTYTFSCFVKAKELTAITLKMSAASTAYDVPIDLSDGTIGTPFSGDVTNTANSVEAFPDGWYRVSATAKANTNSFTGITLFEDSTGNGTDAVYIWGAQLEVGSFPTAYIPTTTTAVTRNAGIESYPVTGNLAANNGTVRIDWTPDQLAMGTVFIWASYVDASNYTAILHDGTNVVFRKRISGTNNDATKALTYVAGTTYTLVGTYSDSVDSEIYVDGVQGTGHANNVDIQIGSSQQVGADGNGANQSYSSQRLLKVFDVTKSAAEVALL